MMLTLRQHLTFLPRRFHQRLLHQLIPLLLTLHLHWRLFCARLEVAGSGGGRGSAYRGSPHPPGRSRRSCGWCSRTACCRKTPPSTESMCAWRPAPLYTVKEKSKSQHEREYKCIRLKGLVICAMPRQSRVIQTTKIDIKTILQCAIQTHQASYARCFLPCKSHLSASI